MTSLAYFPVPPPGTLSVTCTVSGNELVARPPPNAGVPIVDFSMKFANQNIIVTLVNSYASFQDAVPHLLAKEHTANFPLYAL